MSGGLLLGSMVSTGGLCDDPPQAGSWCLGGTEEQEGRGGGRGGPVNDNLTKLGSRTYSTDSFQRHRDVVIYVFLQKNVCWSAEGKRAPVHVHLVCVNARRFPPRNNPTRLIQTICVNQGAGGACGCHPPTPTPPQTGSYLSKQRMACLQRVQALYGPGPAASAAARGFWT